MSWNIELLNDTWVNIWTSQKGSGVVTVALFQGNQTYIRWGRTRRPGNQENGGEARCVYPELHQTESHHHDRDRKTHFCCAWLRVVSLLFCLINPLLTQCYLLSWYQSKPMFGMFSVTTSTSSHCINTQYIWRLHLKSWIPGLLGLVGIPITLTLSSSLWIQSGLPAAAPRPPRLHQRQRVRGRAFGSGRRGSNPPDWSPWVRWTPSDGPCLRHTTWVTCLKWSLTSRQWNWTLWIAISTCTWGTATSFLPVMWTCPCQAQYMYRFPKNKLQRDEGCWKLSP